MKQYCVSYCYIDKKHCLDADNADDIAQAVTIDIIGF